MITSSPTSAVSATRSRGRSAGQREENHVAPRPDTFCPRFRVPHVRRRTPPPLSLKKVAPRAARHLGRQPAATHRRSSPFHAPSHQAKQPRAAINKNVSGKAQQDARCRWWQVKTWSSRLLPSARINPAPLHRHASLSPIHPSRRASQNSLSTSSSSSSPSPRPRRLQCRDASNRVLYRPGARVTAAWKQSAATRTRQRQRRPDQDSGESASKARRVAGAA